MTRRMQLTWWGIAIAVAILVLWTIGGVLAPYISAGVLAYLLTPVADRMVRLGMNRTLAALVLVGIVVVVLVGLVVGAIPLIVRQADELLTNLPDYFDGAMNWLEDVAPGMVEGRMLTGETIDTAEEAVREHGMAVLTGVLAQTTRLVDLVVFLVILPIVAFFLILRWHDIVSAIDALLPRRQAPTFRRLALDIDEVLGGFVRGQFIVALVMTAYYCAALSWAGLAYSLAVGVVAGIGTLVPIVGATVGAVLAVGIALVQFWGDWSSIALVAGLYFGGQLIESNIITPRLVGPHVKLHPVWLLLAFSVFAALFGFVGVLIAVPVAAVIGVLVRFGVEQYMFSELHAGVPRETTVIDAEGRPYELRDAP